MATDGRLNRAHRSETVRAFHSEPMLCMPHVASNAARMVAGTCCAARRSRACIFVCAWSLTGWANTAQVHKRATFGMDQAFKGMLAWSLTGWANCVHVAVCPPPVARSCGMQWASIAPAEFNSHRPDLRYHVRSGPRGPIWRPLLGSTHDSRATAQSNVEFVTRVRQRALPGYCASTPLRPASTHLVSIHRHRNPKGGHVGAESLGGTRNRPFWAGVTNHPPDQVCPI